MVKERRIPMRHERYFVLLGCMFMLLPVSLDQYWSSVSVYALSYFVSRLSYGSEIQTPWTMSTFYIFWTAGFIVSGFLSQHFEPRRMIFAGSTISIVGVFLTYFSVQHSFLLMNMTLAVLCGLGLGFIDANGVQLVANATDTNVGLFISILMSAPSIGAFLITQLITRYANPRDESPNYHVGATTYFTQKDVIERVPAMFLIMSAFTLAAHTVGLVLLNMSTISNTLAKFLLRPKLTETEETAPNENRFSPEYTTHGNVDGNNSSGIVSHQQDYKPKEMLKTIPFYVICFAFVASEYAGLLVINYSKLFGQLWIHDDHFLSNMNTTFIIAAAVLRALCGLVMDKLGCRNCLVIFVSAGIPMTLWGYFTARINRWLYFIVTVMNASTTTALYSCYYAATAVIFGRTHMSSNLGIILASTILFNLVAPRLIEAILTSCGWFTLFASGGAVQLVNLLCCMVFIR